MKGITARIKIGIGHIIRTIAQLLQVVIDQLGNRPQGREQLVGFERTSERAGYDGIGLDFACDT
jgi:hypothetical protein